MADKATLKKANLNEEKENEEKKKKQDYITLEWQRGPLKRLQVRGFPDVWTRNLTRMEFEVCIL